VCIRGCVGGALTRSGESGAFVRVGCRHEARAVDGDVFSGGSMNLTAGMGEVAISAASVQEGTVSAWLSD
jgi:hypothetical protein